MQKNAANSPQIIIIWNSICVCIYQRTCGTAYWFKSFIQIHIKIIITTTCAWVNLSEFFFLRYKWFLFYHHHNNKLHNPRDCTSLFFLHNLKNLQSNAIFWSWTKFYFKKILFFSLCLTHSPSRFFLTIDFRLFLTDIH